MPIYFISAQTALSRKTNEPWYCVHLVYYNERYENWQTERKYVSQSVYAQASQIVNGAAVTVGMDFSGNICSISALDDHKPLEL